MGNTVIGGRSKKAKVMKITGETFKVRTPIRAGDVVKEHQGHVLLNSEAVKQFGVRAKPLEAQQELKPKSIYFLVELPKFDINSGEEERRSDSRLVRRVRSTASIQVGAKERLECLMLSRRAASDLTSTTNVRGGAPARMKIRLPRSQVVKLMEESKDDVEAADKIIQLYMANAGTVDTRNNNFSLKERHEVRIIFF